MRATGKDSGAVRVSYIAKLAIVLAVIGVFGYDGVAILATHVSTESDAQNAANTASENWQTNHNVVLAYDAASQATVADKETVLACAKCFSIAQDNTVTLELRKTAKTVVFSRIGFLKRFTVVTESGQANYNPA
ncbi:MAG TPA: hypothetical protein VHW92_00010 [Mycobacteriales bacterium]|jgi:hypothetical protein|nr:hypothetical protein [Mycobacteriales bacterium]